VSRCASAGFQFNNRVHEDRTELQDRGDRKSMSSTWGPRSERRCIEEEGIARIEGPGPSSSPSESRSTERI